jgi:hypothetical protein
MGRSNHRRALFVGLVFLAGCSGRGSVTGKVTLDGQPLPGGLVTFYHAGATEEETGSSTAAQIKPDGTYEANVIIGKSVVSVATSSGMGTVRNPGAVKDPWGPYVPIPMKYLAPDKSGLSVDVKSGKQVYDIKLVNDAPAEAPK